MSFKLATYCIQEIIAVFIIFNSWIYRSIAHMYPTLNCRIVVHEDRYAHGITLYDPVFIYTHIWNIFSSFQDVTPSSVKES